MDFVLLIALVFGFYMAWSIGANDAANAMGTSVGSKAVTFKEAVIIAVIFEFGGAWLAGSDVANTMRKGIIDSMVFADMPNGANIFIFGMMAALVSAALWIHIAAFLGWPVSTTHSIVGAITGFGITAAGWSSIQWGKVGFIVMSWCTSPLIGGLLAFIVFRLIRKLVLDAKDGNRGIHVWAPILSLPVFVVLSLMLFTKGLKSYFVKPKLVDGVTIGNYYEFGSLQVEGWMVILVSCVFALLSVMVMSALVRKVRIDPEDSTETKYAKVESVFRYLQIITACFVAFAHGSNDVANSIGPLAAIVNTLEVGVIASKVPVPPWVLMLGAAGIAVGLLTYGYRVMETIGTKITEMTPTRGFAAEFGAASTILVGSKFGIPLSTTHTVVGAVIGVGFARGMNALNLRIIWQILQSWVYTIPFTAILSMILFHLFLFLFG